MKINNNIKKLSLLVMISMLSLNSIHTTSYMANYDATGSASGSYNGKRYPITFTVIELNKRYTYTQDNGRQNTVTGKQLVEIYAKYGKMTAENKARMLSGDKVVLAVTVKGGNRDNLDLSKASNWGLTSEANNIGKINMNAPYMNNLKNNYPDIYEAVKAQANKYGDVDINAIGGKDLEKIEEIITGKTPDPEKPPAKHTSCTPYWTEWATTWQDSNSSRSLVDYYMTVNPVVPGDFSKMSKEQRDYWKATHHTQKTKKETTIFGETLRYHNSNQTLSKMMNSSAGSGKNIYNYVIDELNNAKKEDSYIKDKAQIELSDKNKEGFANGGAFTITYWTKYATIINMVSTESRQHFACNEFYVNPEYEYKYVEVKPNEYETRMVKVRDGYWDYNYYMDQTESRTGPASSRVIEDPSFKPENSYQVINVRCNKDRLESFISLINGEITNRGYYSTAAKTPQVSNQVANFITGSVATKDFIYGTDCPINCSSDPKNALSSSKAKDNIQDKGAEERKDSIFNKYFGSQFTEKDKIMNTSEWSFFRDGVNKKIRNDIWTIVGKYKNDEFELPKKGKASQTSFAMNKDATPKIKDDLLNITLEDGVTPLFTADNTRKTLHGEVNTFNISATWASEKDHPIKIQSRYDYEPSINVTVPTNFGSSGTIIKTNKISTPIVASCDQKFNTTLENGANITNNPKHILPEGVHFNNSPEELFTEYIWFVKGSAE